MEFNEDAFRIAATEKGFTAEQIDAYVKQKSTTQTNTSVTTVSNEGFNEEAFRAKASEQGFTKEQQDAYVTKHSQTIVTDPDFFAKPSLDLPFSVKPFYRENSLSVNGQYENPMRVRQRNEEPIFGLPKIPMLTTGINFGTDEEYENKIRNTLDPETVVRIGKQIKANPGTQDGINAVYSHAEREQNWRQDKKELLSNLQELVNIERPFKWIKSNFDNAADAEWRSIQAQNIENIANLAKERGLDIVHQDGEFFAYDQAGNLQRITPEFLDSIGKSKYEIVGGMAGAIAGSRVPVKHPYAKLGAIAVGGIIGTVAGEEIDYLSSAIQAQEELSAKVALEKAIGAAQMGALFEVVGGATGKVLQGSWKQLKRAYDFVADGNTNGAYTALKDTLGYLSDDEIEELVTRWEKLNQQTAPGKSIKEKALATLPSTAPGGEAIVSAAAKQDARAALTIRSDLNARAQSILKLAKNPADNTGQQLQTALKTYTDDVKSAFDIVKKSGSDIAPDGYKFSLLNKSLRPALEETIDEISDPAIVEKLTRLLVKVDERTTSRTFNDLLDLRELLNEFKYATKVTSKSKFVANKGIDEAKAEVDNEIRRIMETTPEGKQWLTDWKDVNKAYGEYKMIQKNALFKAITKPGATPKSIAQSLVKHGPALDDTYSDVIAKLPVQTKALVENEIIDQLANKAALGNVDGFRAISFPDLAQELKVYNFTSSKAIQLKQAVKQLAEVYKNDRALFNLKPGLQDDVGQTIATTITGKMKMAFVNNVWRKMNQAKGGAQADVNALIAKVAKFLENPLDNKAAEKVLKEVGEDLELQAAVKKLQQEVAKETAEGSGAARLKVFKDRRGTKYYQDGPRRYNAASESVPMHRVAKGQEIADLLGRAVTSTSSLTKAEKTILADKGFLAIALENGQLLDLR